MDFTSLSYPYGSKNLSKIKGNSAQLSSYFFYIIELQYFKQLSQVCAFGTVNNFCVGMGGGGGGSVIFSTTIFFFLPLFLGTCGTGASCDTCTDIGTYIYGFFISKGFIQTGSSSISSSYFYSSQESSSTIFLEGSRFLRTIYFFYEIYDSSWITSYIQQSYFSCTFFTLNPFGLPLFFGIFQTFQDLLQLFNSPDQSNFCLRYIALRVM